MSRTDTEITDLYEDDPQADADWLAGIDPTPDLSYTAHYANGFTYRGRTGWPMDLVRVEAVQAAAALGGPRIIAMIGELR